MKDPALRFAHHCNGQTIQGRIGERTLVVRTQGEPAGWPTLYLFLNNLFYFFNYVGMCMFMHPCLWMKLPLKSRRGLWMPWEQKNNLLDEHSAPLTC